MEKDVHRQLNVIVFTFLLDFPIGKLRMIISWVLKFMDKVEGYDKESMRGSSDSEGYWMEQGCIVSRVLDVRIINFMRNQ